MFQITLQPRLPAQAAAGHTTRVCVAGPRCTAMTGCSIGGCGPSSVITTSLSFGHAALHVCAVCRALRQNNEVVWIFVDIVKCSRCPILVLTARLGYSQMSCHAFFNTFFSNIFLIYYQVCTLPRHDRQQTTQHEQRKACAFNHFCVGSPRFCG